MGKERHFKYIM